MEDIIMLENLPNTHRYQTSTEEAFRLIGEIMQEFPTHKAHGVLHGLRTLRENPPAYFSMRDINPRAFNIKNKSGETQTPLIDPNYGSLIFQGELPDSPLGNFFRSKGRTFPESYGHDLRGPNFFVAKDSTKQTYAKLDSILLDITDAIAAINSIQRADIKDPKTLTLYLGALDYIKNHSITLLNAITYRERFPSENERPRFLDDTDYSNKRDMAIQTVVATTRLFYQAFVGEEFDEATSLSEIDSSIQQLVNYIKTAPTKRRKSSMFITIETNNPLVFLLGAHETAKANLNIDTILGIQSGGVEGAVVTQLLIEKLTGRKTSLVFIPVSVHQKSHPLPTLNHLLIILQRDINKIKGENVLMVDDNSSTGTTLQITSEALQRLGAINDCALITQHDPGRIYHWAESTGANYLFKVNHTNHLSTMGVANPWFENELSKRLADYYEQNT